MVKQTPMVQQYLAIKEKYPDAILFFRMGDFYEMFYEDAVTASKVLEITLTSRERGMPESTPLCGVPYHAVDGYLAKMIEAGFKVAICEQIEDPKKAKGIVKRAVTRVVTPGTAISPGRLPAKEPRYMAAVSVEGDRIGLAFLDYSTGEFRATELGRPGELIDELSRLDPREVLAPKKLMDDVLTGAALSDFARSVDPARTLTHPPDHAFEFERARKTILRHFQAETLDGFGISGFPEAVRAAGALLYYLSETQEPEAAPAFEVAGDEPVSIPRPLSHITTLSYYAGSDYMLLDESTKRNLELTRTLRDNKLKGSLFWFLDRTATPMGGRTLLYWLHYPLLDPRRINARQEAVAYAIDSDALRLDLREMLSHVADLERLTARVSTGSAHPRDLIAVRDSLAKVPPIKAMLAGAPEGKIAEIGGLLDPMEDVTGLIESALVDDPPLSVREGGIIRAGYNAEIDELMLLQKDAKSVIAKMEAEERRKTGIQSLKVKYNQVFGYYIEVTNANLPLVPADYIRKQTLVNAERFITPELKELETKVLSAEERLIDLNYELFRGLREKVAGEAGRLLVNARELGRLDCIIALADLAAAHRMCRPVVDDSDVIDIKGGWHPVVAELVKGERFVPNDVRLDSEENQVLIITGPNMAGKSTVLRQTGIIAILAQMGSFVPADEARIGVCDRIFTRVGASDVLVRGMSTFMVEMTEAANILHNATRKSLVLLDEIGRGTSTFDGLSIAWAVAEYLHDTPGREARTMFATHYHELCDLAETRPRIKNWHILVKEWEGEVIFLRKMAPGSTSRSYGIQVARLAGLPKPVIDRAREILANLEAIEHDPAGKPALSRSTKKTSRVGPVQLTLFGPPADPRESETAKRLRAVNLNSLTPLEALALLDELKKLLEAKK